MKVLSTIFSCVIISSVLIYGCTEANSSNQPDEVSADIIEAEETFEEKFIPIWDRATTYTMELLDLMPGEYYDFKPTDEIRSFEEQMIHTSKSFYQLTSKYILQVDNPLDESTLEDLSNDEIKQLLTEAIQYVKDAAINTPQEKLEEEIMLFDSIPMEREDVFFLIRDHMTHHRAQSIIYLRMKGIAPPRYVGW